MATQAATQVASVVGSNAGIIVITIILLTVIRMSTDGTLGTTIKTITGVLHSSPTSTTSSSAQAPLYPAGTIPFTAGG